MIDGAISGFPIASVTLLVVPTVLAILAFCFPVTVLLFSSAVSILGGAGLGLLALATLTTPKDAAGLLGSFVGLQAGITAVGCLLTGLVLAAFAGAVFSIRRAGRIIPAL